MRNPPNRSPPSRQSDLLEKKECHCGAHNITPTPIGPRSPVAKPSFDTAVLVCRLNRVWVYVCVCICVCVYVYIFVRSRVAEDNDLACRVIYIALDTRYALSATVDRRAGLYVDASESADVSHGHALQIVIRILLASRPAAVMTALVRQQMHFASE